MSWIRGESKKKVGLAISTYMVSTTFHGRFEIFKKSLDSLKSISYDGLIIIVDDASEINDHLDYAKSLGFKNLKIIKKLVNSGIAKVKNTSINEILKAGCDVGFLADDDIIYHNGFDELYLNAISETGIEHFYYIIPSDDRFPRVVEGFRIDESDRISGCFIVFTPEIISKIGYFKVMPYRYGFEHCNFTIRCKHHGLIPFYCDIAENGISLIEESIGNSSIDIDPNGLDLNIKQLWTDLDLIEPLIE